MTAWAPTSGGQKPQPVAQVCAWHDQRCCAGCPVRGCRFCGCRRDRDACEHTAWEYCPHGIHWSAFCLDCDDAERSSAEGADPLNGPLHRAGRRMVGMGERLVCPRCGSANVDVTRIEGSLGSERIAAGWEYECLDCVGLGPCDVTGCTNPTATVLVGESGDLHLCQVHIGLPA